MLNRAVTLYGKFTNWIVGGLLIVSVAGGIYSYVTSLKLAKARSDLNASEIKLSVSNASVDSLKVSLIRLNETLENQSRVEKEKQKALTQKLESISKKDQSLIDLENSLKNRKPVLNCSIPKDLEDAWNSL